ncbi:unnamed protein product [Calypogeia fissa]
MLDVVHHGWRYGGSCMLVYVCMRAGLRACEGSLSAQKYFSSLLPGHLLPARGLENNKTSTAGRQSAFALRRLAATQQNNEPINAKLRRSNKKVKKKTKKEIIMMPIVGGEHSPLLRYTFHCYICASWRTESEESELAKKDDNSGLCGIAGFEGGAGIGEESAREGPPAGGWGKLATVREAVVVCSSVDAGVTLWDASSGALLSHLRSCAAPRNALCPVGPHFIAASQSLKPSSSSSGGAIFFWAWHKNQVAFKSYPVEPIVPLACTGEGTYLAGGGLSGRIYLWEVASGKLLRVWSGHYKAVSCLVFSDDDSLLISGADDGLVNVWPLFRVLDIAEEAQGETQITSLYGWSDHTLPVTGLLAGSGGPSAIVVSCSLDHTCKIWSLALGTLLRSIVFPTALNAVILDPGEYALYAGGTDGRIFITALNFGVPTASGILADGLLGTDAALIGHTRAVTALAFSMDGVSLVSGSEDCTARLWDTVSRQVLRTFTHSKGPISSLLVVPRPPLMQHGGISDHQHGARSMNRRMPLLPVAPLSKYVVSEAVSKDPNPWEGPLVVLPSSFCTDQEDADGYSYSFAAMERQIKELEQRGSTAAMQMELERLRSELRRALNNGQQWQQLHQELYCFCVDELMGGNKEEGEEKEGEKEKEKEKEKGKGRGKVAR